MRAHFSVLLQCYSTTVVTIVCFRNSYIIYFSVLCFNFYLNSISVMDILDIFESQKGKEKLAFKKHMYVVHKECSHFIRWKCCKKNSHKCPCILKTSLDKKSLIKIDHEHNHISSQNEIDAAKIKIKIKTRAKITKCTPAQLFSEAMTGLSESILEELPKEKSIKKTIQNQRTQSFPIVPENLTDLKIEGMYYEY